MAFPPCMSVCLPFLAQMDENSHTVSSLVWSLVVWLWFMAGLWSLYAISRHLGLSRTLACAATLLLYLSPRFFAHAHYNDKDLVMLCLMLICLWLGLRFLQKMTVPRAVLFFLFLGDEH